MSTRRKKPKKRVVTETEAKKGNPWGNKPVPEELLKAFRKVVDSGWENTRAYNKYKKLERKYLSKQVQDDPVLQGRFIVGLSRMLHGSMSLDWRYKN